jgi:hypothetical protein
MNKLTLTLVLMIFIISLQNTIAQQVDLKKAPKNEIIESAKGIAEVFFDDLINNRHEKLADFIINSVGYNLNETEKSKMRIDFINKFEIISTAPPQGTHGQLNGYDLIDESSIPGSDRYFRHTYLTYHVGNVVIWEFRFYVDKDHKVLLNYIGWSDNNPFEYLSTPDYAAFIK